MSHVSQHIVPKVFFSDQTAIQTMTEDFITISNKDIKFFNSIIARDKTVFHRTQNHNMSCSNEINIIFRTQTFSFDSAKEKLYQKFFFIPKVFVLYEFIP